MIAPVGMVGQGPNTGGMVVHAGRWQDVVPRLLAAGEVFDVIYFDTFGEPVLR